MVLCSTDNCQSCKDTCTAARTDQTSAVAACADGIRSGARDLCATFAGARVFFSDTQIARFRRFAQTPGHGLRRRTRVCSSVRAFFFGVQRTHQRVLAGAFTTSYRHAPVHSSAGTPIRFVHRARLLYRTLARAPAKRRCVLFYFSPPCPYPLPAIVAGDSAGAAASAGALRISRCWLHRWQKRRRWCRKVRRTRAVGVAVS